MTTSLTGRGASGAGSDELQPEQLLTRAQELLEAGGSAISSYRSAEADHLLGQAASCLEQARRGPPRARLIARVSELELRVRLVRAWVTFEHDGLAQVSRDLRALRDDCLEADRTDLATLCTMQLGLVQGRSGDLGPALASMEAAEQGRASLQPIDQVRLLLNRGTLRTHAMQLEAASADLALAATLAAEEQAEALRFMAVHNQGFVEFLRGDLPRALSLMEQAERLDADVERGVAHLDRARVMLEAGLVDEAHEALTEAARITAESGGRHDLGEIELALARCDLLRADPARAQHRAAQARRLFRTRAEDGWSRLAQVLELEAMATAQSASPRTQARLAQALVRAAAAAGDLPVSRRAALVQAAGLVAAGRHDHAEDAYESARPLLRSPHLTVRMHARHVSALMSAAAGRPEAAVRVLRRAAEDLGAAGRQAAGLDLRTALSVHGAHLVELDLDLAMRGGSPARVLTRTEVWRDVIRALPPVRAAQEPRRAAAISTLRRAREDLRTASPGAEASSLRGEVGRAERAVRELDWATAVEDVSDVEQPGGAMSAVEIRAAVQHAGVTMLSTFASGPEVHAVLLTPDGSMSLHHLGSLERISGWVGAVQSDLGAAARVPSSSPLRGVVRSSLAHGLEDLERALLAPLVSAGLETRPLVVVATPLLTMLPWGMLPARRGRPTTVVRSATSWARRHTRVAGRPEVRAIAGPDVALADTEVTRVIETWGTGRSIPAARSRADDLVPALEECDVVHVAAHGEHHAQNPLFSSLRLGDGAVFAHEIEGHRLRASHVVLSACDAGRISVRRGEEALGMTASLLALGVSTVVAAVSPVPDEVAHEVMSNYHGEIAGGVDAATALATATGSGEILGASFTCFGSSWRCVDGVSPGHGNT